ncbi:MAG: response regulator [Candidatus Omnitrophica bacterium]|nr:response regulator [Candidatus Omnitrophota bacterium]
MPRASTVLPNEARLKRSKPTLLIVDDESGPRESLKVVFRDDYSVLLAENGDEAIEFARNGRIDAAVLDIRLSDLSGIEVLEHLKTIDPGIEVIILTGYASIETARQAMRLGACDYLNKPIEIDIIRTAVAEAVKRRCIANKNGSAQRAVNLGKAETHDIELERANSQFRSEIYASIIHDINGSLSAIAAFSELMHEEISEADCLSGKQLNEFKSTIARISKNAKACIEISRRYVQLLKAKPSEETSTAVNPILQDLQDLLRIHPSTRGHQLLIQSLPADVRVQINGTELLQIILNLAMNAFQCTPEPHRIEIRGRWLPRPLDVRSWVDTQEDRFLNRDGLSNIAPLLAVSVTDNGPGISPGVAKKIFTPFFTTKPSGQGLGLGLSIVFRLVSAARGAIHLHTRFGHGTCFTVYLPATAGPR